MNTLIREKQTYCWIYYRVCGICIIFMKFFKLEKYPYV